MEGNRQQTYAISSGGLIRIEIIENADNVKVKVTDDGIQTPIFRQSSMGWQFGFQWESSLFVVLPQMSKFHGRLAKIGIIVAIH